ncbi:kinase-like domain-containing protein [Durotheca rogersii]|uniref:kinase-like domain-containing protein n=1 Tax=Durotheca rogersii TaxID=419775 RepID=UPI002220E76E|nr:kinase-like domain-containing protein [Durotheca rogersii]KAI5862978.1 kinase-like domain-containing protein [Durotheca rogersii]
MSHPEIEVWRNHEREFRIYPDRFYKRSFRPDEYQLDIQNKPYVPPLGPERIRNEAACLQFIRQTTNIPVPDVLEAYEEDGSFVLVTRLLSGVQMSKLPSEDQAVVMKEVDSYLQILRKLQSNHIGGPSGIVCPPQRATQYFPKDTVWSISTTPETDLVFCHCDLSQSNIIVDPITLKIEGIIDWEYGGYWPAFFETPYFRDPRPSGAQFRTRSENNQLVDFLRNGMSKSKVT